MASILQELYYGNITPNARGVKRGSAYNKAGNKMTEAQDMCCLIFTVPAYAQSNEPQPEATPAPVETEAEPETQNPFTPDGTGTVVDNATDEDGKEFYTIWMAPNSMKRWYGRSSKAYQ